MTEPSAPACKNSPPTEPHVINLRDYWRILVRRRNVVLACLGSVVLLTAVLNFLATPDYQATATVQIERQGPDILTFKDVLSVDSAGYHDFYQTQYKILQSRAVLRIAAERMDLMNRPEYAGRKPSPMGRLVGWGVSLLASGEDEAPSTQGKLERAVTFLGTGLSVQPVRRSHLVRLSFIDRDPDLARDVVNTIVEAYEQFNLEARYSTTAQASEFLTKQVAQLQAEIGGLERDLQEYGVEKEILVVGEETQDITSQALADLNRRYTGAMGQLALAEARFQAIGEAPTHALPEVLNSPLISRLKQQCAEIERDHSQMSERFKPDWPALRQLREELEMAREQLETETEGIAHQVRGVAQTDYQEALAEVDRLGRQVEQQKAVVQRVGRDTIEYASIGAEINTKRTLLDELVSRQSQTKISDRLKTTRASNVRVVDLAQSPKSPIKPRRVFNVFLSFLFGTILGVGVALLLDHLDNTIKDEQDVERISGLSVLGQISLFRPLRVVAGEDAPSQSSGQDPIDLGSHLDSRSGFAEAFKNLRTSILLASPERPPRHIVVTSCEPGDGKSTVSLNLAIVLTQLGRRVLVIDADLRRPRVHKMLGLPNKAGLSSYLTGNAPIEDLLQESPLPNLRIVTAGPIPPTPSELLGSQRLQALLEQITEEGLFDHVILDSAPSLGVADAVILASRADATIVVVRSGKTARESLAQGVARLRQTRSHVVGAVLNGVPEQSSYYYGRYRYYGADEDETRPMSSTRGGERRRRLTGTS